MKVRFILENDRIIGYELVPLSKDMIEVDKLPSDVDCGKYNLVNGKIVEVGYTEEQQTKVNEQKLNELRYQRQPLLEAFDKYRSAVIYGIVTETEEEHQAILTWYNNLLDIKKANVSKEAVPAKVAYYL